MSEGTDDHHAIDEPPERMSLVERKSFRDYGFEFLMIFLAVFLGFLAETFRENLSDRTREKAYIRSLILNLEDDDRRLSILIAANENKLRYLDTVRRLSHTALQTPDFLLKVNRTMGQGICCVHFFKSNDAIMRELKNGGGWALLPRNVVDSVGAYDADLYDIEKEESQYENNGMRAIDFFLTITDDWGNYNSSVTADKRELKMLFNYAVNVWSTVDHYKYLLIKQKAKARNLIRFLKKEYNL